MENRKEELKKEHCPDAGMCRRKKVKLDLYTHKGIAGKQPERIG